MATDILQQSQGFFDQGDQPLSAILPLQTDPSLPEVSGLATATSMVLPDRTVESRLGHFPEDLYDLRPESHLVRLLQSLLGDSGGGQLRKRNSVAAFQNAMQSTRFYDLDRFYGAIFGLLRTTSELLWINPHTSVATPNEWDEVDTRDASFRDRITRLASAINLGATYPGIKAAAEALINVECDVYEVWSLIDTYGTASLSRSWDDMDALGTWDQIEDIFPSPSLPSWDYLGATSHLGRTGTNSRSEVIIRPKKDYTRLAYEDGAAEADRQQSEDISAMVRVLSVLKPAGVLLTVEPDGLSLHLDAHITNLVADSNYWEVVTHVTPRPDLISRGGNPYPLSAKQVEAGLEQSSRRVIPQPPLSTRQAAEWSYNPEVVAVRSYTFEPTDPSLEEPGDGPRLTGRASDTVTYHDGTSETFTADRGILDPRRALAARYAAEGTLVAHPYSTERTAEPSNG